MGGKKRECWSWRLLGRSSIAQGGCRKSEGVWTFGYALIGVEGGVPRASWVYFALVKLKYCSEN